MAVNQFDCIALFYDRLARLVFDDQLLESQTVFLKKIGFADRILIVGGGSGQLLEYLPRCNAIDYVEKSVRMIDLAKKRKVDNRVEFIHCDFFDFRGEGRYNAIICPFFLDCFNEDNLSKIIQRLAILLEEEGILIVTDFQQSNSSFLISLMHLFFRVFAHLESRKLQDIHSFILAENFLMKEAFFLSHQMVFSRLYSKNPVETGIRQNLKKLQCMDIQSQSYIP